MSPTSQIRRKGVVSLGELRVTCSKERFITLQAASENVFHFCHILGVFYDRDKGVGKIFPIGANVEPDR